jgi:hypothetical protein
MTSTTYHEAHAYNEAQPPESTMNELPKELSKLQGFIATLQADREAQKAKEQREAWTLSVSLTVVVVAVCAAIATQSAGRYTTQTLSHLNDATFNQAQASNQWAYYQAKSIKLHLYTITREQVRQDGADVIQLEQLNGRIATYNQEKDEITQAAKAFEKKRDDAREAARIASEHGAGMNLAISLFSIAIAMASICAVTKKKPLWFLSMALAILAIAQVITVWAT